ncbi:MAG TPA: 50S ribosomal protein L44e [Candidatus Nanoarchaeia archaeon]|nr:50S ribosomal protein L44e [Candidatus Nanoarchaeia archaeon]
MKIPKTQKKYCPWCNKATEHKVDQYKSAGKRGSLSHGSIMRAKLRGQGRGAGNKGKWGSKPAISKFKRTGAKISKKTTLRFACKECKKTIQQNQGFRAKKVEFI